MSDEGDSAKNSSAEPKEAIESEDSADSSQDSQDLKSKSSEESVNNVEKIEDENKSEVDGKTKDEDKSEASVNDAKDSSAEENDVEKDKDDAEEKDDNEDESEASEDDSKKKDDVKDKGVPLLDQPLEQSGKRERKNIQRFSEEVQSSPKDSPKHEVPSGSGTALGDIPKVDASISRFKNDDLKILHEILFGSTGKTALLKKSIRKFNGFEFKKDSDEYSKKNEFMQKFEVKQLKSVCEMLDLEKTGNKDAVVTKILDFLLEPKDTVKTAGGGRPKRTAAVKANNRGYSPHDDYSSDERHTPRARRDKGQRANLKDDSSSGSDEDFNPSEEEEKPRANRRRRTTQKKVKSDDDVSDIDSPTSDDSDFQEEPKSKKKKGTKSNNKAKTKTPSRRGRKPAGKKTPGRKRKSKASSDDEENDKEDKQNDNDKEATSSSEDEPLAKKAKNLQPPTDEEIKTYVKEILEGANLEEITMKTVCQQVYSHYPDFDITHKKEFIKSTVKSLIST